MTTILNETSGLTATLVNVQGKMHHAKSEDKHKLNLKPLWITLGVLLGLIVVLYFAGAFYFKNHFGYGTVIDNMDFSFKTVEDYENMASSEANKYSLAIKGRDNHNYTLTARAIGLEYVSDGQVDKVLEEQNHLLWFMRFFEEHESITTNASVSYDTMKFDLQLESLNLFGSATNKPPEDAYIAHVDDGYKVMPEQQGSTLDHDLAKRALHDAILVMQPSVDFDELKCYLKPTILSDRKSVV